MDMAGSGRGPGTGVIQELFDTPDEFDFFQAVRLIELYALQQNCSASESVGGDKPTDKEPVRFGVVPSLSFPPGEVITLKPRQDGDSMIPLDMVVSFMGLTGPNGVLPQHYSSLLIERAHQRYKDYTLRAFFDLFNHRCISLFYQAWKKYRLTFIYERKRHDVSNDDDLVTKCLFSTIGLQASGLRRRFSFDDELLVAFGGLFAQRTRSAAGLEKTVTGCFRIPAQVQQFVGQWLPLPVDLQSGLPSKRHPAGLNLKLGESVVAGSRVWDVQNCVCVQLGPMGIEQFNSLLPENKRLTKIAETVRFYLGPDKDFHIQLILKKADVPVCCLTESSRYTPRLGQNTWLPKAGRVKDATDAVFRFS